MSAILLCRTGDDAGLAHPILEDRCLIGRGADCSLSLLHPQLSRNHAAVSQVGEEGALEVEDLGSKNGTRLNGELLAANQPQPLKHLDRLTFGTDLEFVLLELSRVPAAEIVAAHVLDGSGTRVPLQLGENAIGSGDTCDLIVTDPNVAPVHARLELSADGLLLCRDANADQLTVNGEQVGEARLLEDGDYLELSNQAEFGIEIIRGFAVGPPRKDQQEVTARSPAVEGSGPRVHEEPQPDFDSTETLEATEIRAALEKARARHEVEMARRVKNRKEAQQERTSGPGTQGYSIEEEDGSATVKRTWASKTAPMPRPLVQPSLQAVRRESAARLLFTPPGSSEEQGRLLREGRHVVGRHEGCRVVFSDASVSREHAEIHVGPQGIIVKDLGSANGTWRGGERIDQATFEDGDSVRFGVIECRFELI